MNLTSKYFALITAELIESDLLVADVYVSWSDKLIENLDDPPQWILELAFTKRKKDSIIAIRSNLNDLPFDEESWKVLSDFHIGCLYVKYAEGKISWSKFLEESGFFSDGNSSVRVECEYFFLMHNKYREGNFNVGIESSMNQEIRFKFDDVIDMVYENLEIFSKVP